MQSIDPTCVYVIYLLTCLCCVGIYVDCFSLLCIYYNSEEGADRCTPGLCLNNCAILTVAFTHKVTPELCNTETN